MVVKELVNLNADSTHPNPWKPRNVWERHTFYYNPYKIFRGNPTDVKPLYNPISQDPFWSTLGLAAYRGVLVGSGLAITDIMFISQIQGLRAQLARYLFVMPPYAAMPISYIATREVMQNFFGDTATVYFWSMVAPASIYGAFRNSIGSGVRLFMLTAWFPAAYKLNNDLGGLFHSYDDHVRLQHSQPSTWKINFPFKPFAKFDEGPSWKKWVDPAKTNAGPDL